MVDTSATQIEAPFDSGDYPKSVLVQGDDISADTTCDECQRPAEEWPAVRGGWGVPAAMYQAALYCAGCMPLAYDEYTGERVSTLTGCGY